MIFSELYGAYYNTVAKILKAATAHPLSQKEIQQIVCDTAFGESILSIVPALKEENWQLTLKDGSTPIRNIPSMPLTILQKRWLKAISLDPRIKLFTDDFPAFDDVEPLFTQDDYCVFDRYADGDPYEDPTYIRYFRLILDAIKNRTPLSISVTNRKESITNLVVMPEYLEYSEKDDKFRLVSLGGRHGSTVNLARIISCRPFSKEFNMKPGGNLRVKKKTVEFELIDQRNALERVLLHFAHFEKEAEKLDDDRYLIKIVYDRDDETEIVIRILSFGPMIKVISPQGFVERIKERLSSQKSCGQ